MSGFQEWTEKQGDNNNHLNILNTFLDSLQLSFIGMRVLADEYLFYGKRRNESCVNKHCLVREVVLSLFIPLLPLLCLSLSIFLLPFLPSFPLFIFFPDGDTKVHKAIADATSLCIEKNGEAPDVKLTGNLNLTFTCVEFHLHFILFEVLKNAMRATLDKHFSSPSLPVIVIDILQEPLSPHLVSL